jgi:hypothetical protein
MEGSNADVRALGGELKKAEAALKRSKTKDYYKILGTSVFFFLVAISLLHLNRLSLWVGRRRARLFRGGDQESIQTRKSEASSGQGTCLDPHQHHRNHHRCRVETRKNSSLS